MVILILILMGSRTEMVIIGFIIVILNVNVIPIFVVVAVIGLTLLSLDTWSLYSCTCYITQD